MQLLNVDCSEDILVCVTKCTELLLFTNNNLNKNNKNNLHHIK